MKVKKDELMTMMEASALIKQRVAETLRTDLSPEERHEANEQSRLCLGFAKQAINLADVTLRGEKLMAQCKSLNNSRINAVLGEIED